VFLLHSKSNLIDGFSMLFSVIYRKWLILFSATLHVASRSKAGSLYSSAWGDVPYFRLERLSVMDGVFYDGRNYLQTTSQGRRHTVVMWSITISNLGFIIAYNDKVYVSMIIGTELYSASEMTYIVSGGALNSTNSTQPSYRPISGVAKELKFWHTLHGGRTKQNGYHFVC